MQASPVALIMLSRSIGRWFKRLEYPIPSFFGKINLRESYYFVKADPLKYLTGTLILAHTIPALIGQLTNLGELYHE